MSEDAKRRGAPEPDGPHDDEDRSRANIVAIVFILVLYVGAFWLFKSLQSHREIENCIASGRRDCIDLTAKP